MICQDISHDMSIETSFAITNFARAIGSVPMFRRAGPTGATLH